MVTSRIIQLTVPCSDNGERFIQSDRLDLISYALAKSDYEIMANLPLAKIYRHCNFQTCHPIILISCHIDSVYQEYFAHVKGAELNGTLDNSACNAIIVEAMVNSLLPPQVLVTFTGDEEEDSRGVDQTIETIKELNLFNNLEMVITLDLTEEHYRNCNFTIENYFVKHGVEDSLLKFGDEKHIKAYLRKMIDSPVFVNYAEADESWRYEEYNLNCFSLCLPCRLLGDNMHSDTGVAIITDSIAGYMNALIHLTQAIFKDLATKEKPPTP